jgi:hypothetical protein
MYIDSKKFKYTMKGKGEPDETARDKAFAIESYKSWINDQAEEIVERLWSIDDIGIVEQVGEFTKLLKEAEFTYSLGAYTSTIAMVGVCAEDLCRFFANSIGANLDRISQNDRIEELSRLGVLSQNIQSDFHQIRHLRNDCLHFNQSFKAKDAATIQSEALLSLNAIKSIYKNLLGNLGGDDFTVESLLKIIDALAQELSDGSPTSSIRNMDDLKARYRNVMYEAFGFDLSIGGSNRDIERYSLFEVLDIDEDEITLKDISSKLPVIVDLSADETAKIHAVGILPNSIVAAVLKSKTDMLGISASWNFSGLPSLIRRV